MDIRIKDCCFHLPSDKITYRKKYAEACLDLLSNDAVLQKLDEASSLKASPGDIDWNTLFKAAREFFFIEASKFQAEEPNVDELSASKRTTREKSKLLCSSLIKTIMQQSCRTGLLYLDVEIMLDHIFDVFHNALLYEYFGQDYMRLLVRDILPQWGCWTALKVNDWLSLLIFVLKTWKGTLESASTTSKVIMADMLYVIIEKGHAQSDFTFVNRLAGPKIEEFLVEVVHGLSEKPVAPVEDAILRLTLSYAQAVSSNFPFLLCRFGQATLKAILELWSQRLPHRKKLIIEYAKLQLIAHTANPDLQNAEKWYRCLFRIKEILDKAMISYRHRQQTDLGEEFPRGFFAVAADATFYLSKIPPEMNVSVTQSLSVPSTFVSSTFPSTLSTQMIKRRKLISNHEELLDMLTEDVSVSSFPWLCLLTAMVHRHPEDFAKTVPSVKIWKSLSKLLTSHRSLCTFSQVLRLARAILLHSSPPKLNELTEFQSFWQVTLRTWWTESDKSEIGALICTAFHRNLVPVTSAQEFALTLIEISTKSAACSRCLAFYLENYALPILPLWQAKKRFGKLLDELGVQSTSADELLRLRLTYYVLSTPVEEPELMAWLLRTLSVGKSLVFPPSSIALLQAEFDDSAKNDKLDPLQEFCLAMSWETDLIPVSNVSAVQIGEDSEMTVIYTVPTAFVTLWTISVASFAQENLLEGDSSNEDKVPAACSMYRMYSLLDDVIATSLRPHLEQIGDWVLSHLLRSLRMGGTGTKKVLSSFVEFVGSELVHFERYVSDVKLQELWELLRRQLFFERSDELEEMRTEIAPNLQSFEQDYNYDEKNYESLVLRVLCALAVHNDERRKRILTIFVQLDFSQSKRRMLPSVLQFLSWAINEQFPGFWDQRDTRNLVLLVDKHAGVFGRDQRVFVRLLRFMPRIWNHLNVLSGQAEKLQAIDLLRQFYTSQKEGLYGEEVEKAIWACLLTAVEFKNWALWRGNTVEPGLTLIPIALEGVAGLRSPSPSVTFYTARLVCDTLVRMRENESEQTKCQWIMRCFRVVKRALETEPDCENWHPEAKLARQAVISQLLLSVLRWPCVHFDAFYSLVAFSVSTQRDDPSDTSEKIRRSITRIFGIPCEKFFRLRASRMMERLLRENPTGLEAVSSFLRYSSTSEFVRTFQKCIVPYYFVRKNQENLTDIANNLRISMQQLLKNNFPYLISQLLICLVGAKKAPLSASEAQVLLERLRTEFQPDFKELICAHWNELLANLLDHAYDEALAADLFDNQRHDWSNPPRPTISADQWLKAFHFLQSWLSADWSELFSVARCRKLLQKTWSRVSRVDDNQHEQQQCVVAFVLLVELVLQMAQSNRNGIKEFVYVLRLVSFRAVQLLDTYPRAGLELLNYLSQAVTDNEHLLLPFVPFLLQNLANALKRNKFQTHMPSLRKLLEWFVVENRIQLESTLKLVVLANDCALDKDLVGSLESIRYRTRPKSLENELELFLETFKYENALYPGMVQRLSESVREFREELEDLRKMEGQSLLHSCLAALRHCCRNTNKPELTESALKCLGELGPIAFANRSLQFFDTRPKPWPLLESVPMQKFLLWNIAETTLIHLFAMERSLGKEDSKIAGKVIEAILASEEGNAFLNMAAKNHYAGLPYLRAYMSTDEISSSNSEKVNVVSFYAKVDCEQLWCPMFALPKGQTWLANIIMAILDCLSQERTIFANLVPVIQRHENLAVELFPFLVHYLLVENFNEVRPILSKYFRLYFTQAIGKKGTEVDECAYLHNSNIAVMVQLILYLRSQEMPASLQSKMSCPVGLARNFWLDLNLFHVAQAANACNAHFSAILLAELSCDALNPCDKQDIPIKEDVSIYGLEPDPLPTLISACYVSLGIMNQEPGTQYASGVVSALDMHSLLEKLPQLLLNRTEQLLSESNESIEDLQLSSSSYLKEWHLKGAREDTTRELVDWSWFKCGENLVQGIPESIFAIYPSLVQLRQLNEMEMFRTASQERFMEFLHRWETQTDPQFGYEQSRFILNRRYDALLQMARKDSSLKSRVLEGYSHQAKLAQLANYFIEADKILDMSETLAEDGYDKLFSLRLEKAKCCWTSGLENIGLELLKSLVKDVTQAQEYTMLPLLMELRGKWEDETRLNNSENILCSFKDAVKMALTHNPALLPQAMFTLALYCDKQVQEIKSYVNSDAYKQRMKARETIAQEVDSLGQFQMSNTERGPIYLTKSSRVEQNEAEMLERRRKTLLEVAVDNYLAVLSHTEIQDNHLQVLFRLVALWMENRLDDRVAELLQKWLPKIPSQQWIPLLPQLAARIVRQARPAMYNSAFPKILQTIFVAVARHHPFHALPLLLAIANSALESSMVKDSIEEDRIRTAIAMLNALKSTSSKSENSISEITVKMEKLYNALIDIANMEPEKNTSCKLPRNHALFQVRNLHGVPIPTIEVSVQPDGRYDNVISIASFDDKYQLVGGINAPKRLFCTGTDGQRRSILVKGKDDLRQDAVMQQLFGTVNRFLERDSTTRDCKLRMNTYKVVPLSKLSGVIEWCENTTTLEGLLGSKDGLHVRYFPRQIKPEASYQIMRQVMVEPNLDKKLTKFKELLTRLSPAMHYFFLEKFPNPAEWFEKRLAYTRSVAVASMVGYILGLGDRHMANVLLNMQTAEVIHIDFGIAFEQGSLLPIPEIVPFRLTPDIVDGMGVMGTSGIFEKSCVLTMQVLRKERASILTLLEVLLYDPMYLWIVAPDAVAELQRKRKKAKHDKPSTDDEVNANASRVLLRVGRKLQGMEESTPFSVEGQVRALIRQACDPSSLCRMYFMWKPHM